MWRGLTLAFCVAATPVAAQKAVEVRDASITARFEGPTARYGHNVLGGLPEWTRLCISGSANTACITLPENAVFEDIAPRLADMDGDGKSEVIVVESTTNGGAALVIYGLKHDGVTRVSTPPIGRRNRWLAPIGIADFDGDGRMDLAYVEKPHLARILRVWSWAGDHLTPRASIDGFSNHRIGDRFIQSGLRDCGAGPEMVVPNALWTRLLSVRYDGDWIVGELPHDPLRGLDAALNCR